MKKKVYFTFGNHMHWIDMEWIWGQGTLANSVEDMLKLVNKVKIKGAINFDALGYEYLAARYPKTLRKLKQAIKKGLIEISGGSFTQPYGLFCGEESNIQQLLHGIKICERLFGIRPKFFWEEEFYFFPQLPQILKKFGYKSACLFFQETWHTPFVPKSKEKTIFWEGKDGTTIPTLSMTDFCIHQWPEHLNDISKNISDSESPPILVQWLELMDSPLWMCRAELIEEGINKLRKNLNIISMVPSKILGKNPPNKKSYINLYDVYQGLSLGKNGDFVRQYHRKIENEILDGQTMATIGYLSGTYPQWSSYPDWEFDEAWRNLMIGQAHDIDECEGLCGDIGKLYLRKAEEISKSIVDRYMKHFSRLIGDKENVLVFNPLPWKRNAYVEISENKNQYIVGVRNIEGPGFNIAKRHCGNKVRIVEIKHQMVTLNWKNYNCTVKNDGLITIEKSGKKLEFNKMLASASSHSTPMKNVEAKNILPDLVEVKVGFKIGGSALLENLIRGIKEH